MNGNKFSKFRGCFAALVATATVLLPGALALVTVVVYLPGSAEENGAELPLGRHDNGQMWD